MHTIGSEEDFRSSLLLIQINSKWFAICSLFNAISYERFFVSIFVFSSNAFQGNENITCLINKKNTRDRSCLSWRCQEEPFKQNEYFNVIPKFNVLDIFVRDAAITFNHHSKDQYTHVSVLTVARCLLNRKSLWS